MKETNQLSLFSFFERNYSEFLKRKINGSRERMYFSQSEEAKNEHKILLEKILRKLYVREYELKKYVGISPLENIEKHSIFIRPKKGKYKCKTEFRRFWFVVDIKSAYESFTFEMLNEFLMAHSLELDLLNEIREKCFTPSGVLITGATCSPFLFNFYLGNTLDKKLFEYTKDRNIIFTRYFDDIVFSSQKVFGKRRKRDIYSLVREIGLEISIKKVRVLDLTRGPIKINGYFLTIDKDSGYFNISLDRNYLKKTREIILRAIQDNSNSSRSKIDGMMGPVLYLVRNFKKRRSFKVFSYEQELLDLYLNYTIKVRIKNSPDLPF